LTSCQTALPVDGSWNLATISFQAAAVGLVWLELESVVMNSFFWRLSRPVNQHTGNGCPDVATLRLNGSFDSRMRSRQ
jgi:hypothetical protein